MGQRNRLRRLRLFTRTAIQSRRRGHGKHLPSLCVRAAVFRFGPFFFERVCFLKKTGSLAILFQKPFEAPIVSRTMRDPPPSIRS